MGVASTLARPLGTWGGRLGVRGLGLLRFKFQPYLLFTVLPWPNYLIVFGLNLLSPEIIPQNCFWIKLD